MLKTKFEDFSKEAQNGIKMFQEWIRKIPVENLEDENFGFTLINDCTSNHEIHFDEDYRPDFRYEKEYDDLELFECCMYQLSDMVISLCIFSGSSIKEANEAADFASNREFWRKDVM